MSKTPVLYYKSNHTPIMFSMHIPGSVSSTLSSNVRTFKIALLTNPIFFVILSCLIVISCVLSRHHKAVINVIFMPGIRKLVCKDVIVTIFGWENHMTFVITKFCQRSILVSFPITRYKHLKPTL